MLPFLNLTPPPVITVFLVPSSESQFFKRAVCICRVHLLCFHFLLSHFPPVITPLEVVLWRPLVSLTVSNQCQFSGSATSSIWYDRSLAPRCLLPGHHWWLCPALLPFTPSSSFSSSSTWLMVGEGKLPKVSHQTREGLPGPLWGYPLFGTLGKNLSLPSPLSFLTRMPGRLLSWGPLTLVDALTHVFRRKYKVCLKFICSTIYLVRILIRKKKLNFPP